MSLKKYIPFFVITILVVVVCWPSLSGNFIFDDNMLVKDNPYIKNFHSLSSYLTQEDGIVDKTDKMNLHTGYYRPLLNFTYSIDYWIWGMNPFGFRLTNIILHLICCLLIFQLLLRLKINRLAALFGTIFFAIHPVNTETISMIVCRNNLMVTIFSILSFILYIESRRGCQTLVILSVFFFCFALLSKEVALMTLPVFFLYNRLIDTENRNMLKEFLSYLPFLLIVIIYLILRSQVIGAFISPVSADGFLTRLYFIPYIISYNFLLVFVPYGLHSFYIKYPVSYFGFNVVISYIFILLLITTLWILRNHRLLIFSITASLVSLLPVMHIIPFASPSIITMRWLYFPLALLTIALAFGFQSAMMQEKKKMMILCLTAILFMYFGIYAYVLNDTLWKNNRSFLNIEVLQFNNLLFAGTLAEELHTEKRLQEAENLYLDALHAFPDKAETYINYSALLIETGRFQNAQKYLDRSKVLIISREERCYWYNNMGVTCLSLNQIQCALDNLRKAVQYCPENPSFVRNLQYVDKQVHK